ncbi:hypothetical protein ASE92_06580 [Pedobacter sp. Leaf41]|uniref:hypothetical protein n=1 Tax=Pedobacter sp. Leaf41 TaxID=1736218 RepID=UPI0007038C55|nr:hypothetical protein [Pedobacter sp. Leaf41]KQN35807.1 hypothetical protein ASE92_06580 [Pedobacter sp. Leaf41]
MIEEETAKRFRDNSPVKDKAATRSARFFIGYLCCRKKAFSRFIQDQIHALIFVSFYQEKEKSHSAASRGKPQA